MPQKKIYIKGIHNTVADAILWLEYDPKLNKTNEYTHAMLGVEPEELSAQWWKSFAHHWQCYHKISTPMQAHCIHMNEVLANCSDKDEIYSLTPAEVAAAQQANASLKHLFKCNAVIDQELEIKLIENTTCVCKDDRLVIPKPLKVCAVKWYHHYLQHPRHTRLKETMNTAMYWKGMHTTIRSLTKSCKSCQVNKRRSQKYWPLPPKTIYTIPWQCLCVGLIGPYTLKGKDNLQIDFMALTMIDSASGLFEIAELPVVKQLRWQTVNGKELLIADEIFDKTLECVAKLVNKTWLFRYPQCRHLIYNNGSEFKLHFKYLCESYGIKGKPTMVKNPWANGILECVHQVLGQMLCTAELDMVDSVTPDDVNVFLDNAAWAIRSTYHTVHKASPGAAIFGQDMLFDIPFVADWNKIGERRQSLTDRGNQHAIAKQVDYDYKVRDKVLVINEGILRKAESTYGKEPWTITTVHTNGTIRIQPGTKMEQLSIRRVEPFTDDIQKIRQNICN
jgi:hypothetical protein